MPGLRLLRSRSVYLLAVLVVLVMPAVASAANGFTEQVASARWLIRSSARMAPRQPMAV